MAQQKTKYALWGAIGLLLLVATGLILRIRTLPLDNDEIWTIWQTFGTPQQIIRWTSSSEYPTYMLLLGAWKDIIGFHPYILHYLSILLALPAAAFTYRAVRRLSGEWAGIIAALAYTSFPIYIFYSLQVRSYAIVYAALPLTLWLSSRYFDRPSFKRGLLLGLALYVMYIGNVSILPALVIFALYLLVMYPRRILYGLFPGILALLLILPDYLTNKLGYITNYSSGSHHVELPPLPQAWFTFFDFFTQTGIWYVLVGLALIIAIYRLTRTHLERGQRTNLIFWIGWLVAIPLILYVLEPILGFFAPHRYGWWYVFGLALLLGMGLAFLPKLGRFAVIGIFALLAFFPYKLNTYNLILTPLGDNMDWLRSHIQAEDALMLDPAITCKFPEEWDYYTRLYFPQGLRYISTPEGTQRLWYVESQNDASRAVENQLAQTRMPGRFVGPPGCFFRLYEAPPNTEGILFENGMRFHGFQIMDGDKPLNYPLVFRDSEPIRVRLWWSVDAPVPLDYSVSLNTRASGTAQTQSDSAPQLIYPESASGATSQWIPGQIYVEERTIDMPVTDFRRTYGLALSVYWYGEPAKRFAAPGTNADGTLLLTPLTIVAW